MTEWQINFASDFWTERLRINPKITKIDAERFRSALVDHLKKHNPSAVCTVVRPQMSLTIALRESELPFDSLPLGQIDLVFVADGSIRVYDGENWTEKREE